MPCTDTIFASPPAFQPSLRQRLGHGFTRVLTRLAEWHERAEQRQHLAGMDERMRKDIGITYADAVREAEKPFWRG